MNVLPQQLNGKVVKDCYQDWKGEVVIEFTDGTKVKVTHEEQKYGISGHEVSIPVELF